MRDRPDVRVEKNLRFARFSETATVSWLCAVGLCAKIFQTTLREFQTSLAPYAYATRCQNKIIPNGHLTYTPQNTSRQVKYSNSIKRKERSEFLGIGQNWANCLKRRGLRLGGPLQSYSGKKAENGPSARFGGSLEFLPTVVVVGSYRDFHRPCAS